MSFPLRKYFDGFICLQYIMRYDKNNIKISASRIANGEQTNFGCIIQLLFGWILLYMNNIEVVMQNNNTIEMILFRIMNNMIFNTHTNTYMTWC